MNQTQLRIQLTQELDTLKKYLQELTENLSQEESYPIWVWQQSDPIKARQEAIRIINLIEYEDDQDPQRTIICPALIGVSQETLAMVEKINAIKLKLNDTMQSMDKIKIKVFDPEREKEVTRPLLKAALASLGHARLHRKQAVRKIESLNSQPISVGYSWAHTRKIQRITVADAINRLEERLQRSPYDNYLLSQLALVKSIPYEEVLAFVEPPHIHPRVNLLWQDKVSGKMQRAQKRGTMPILYLSQADAALPKLSPLPLDKLPPKTRNRRNDQSVEDAPFLASIHVHRYVKK